MKQCFASFYIKMAGDKGMSVMIIRDQLWKIQITSNPNVPSFRVPVCKELYFNMLYFNCFVSLRIRLAG